MGLPAVEIKHLRKTYGPLVAVDDVSLSVAEGEIFGILGASSAGSKTVNSGRGCEEEGVCLHLTVTYGRVLHGEARHPRPR